MHHEDRQKDRQRRINIILDPVTHKRLRIEAVERDQPMNLIARTVMSDHFSKEHSNECK